MSKKINTEGWACSNRISHLNSDFLTSSISVSMRPTSDELKYRIVEETIKFKFNPTLVHKSLIEAGHLVLYITARCLISQFSRYVTMPNCLYPIRSTKATKDVLKIIDETMS